MRLIIVVKGNQDLEAGTPPDPRLMSAMADYHDELAKAGVLLDASGLKPTSKGARIKYSGGGRTWIDGPFTESKEIIAGYTLIQVKSRAEGLEWAKRFPAPFGADREGEIEIRELFELDDFAPGEAIERLRELGSRPNDGCRYDAPAPPSPIGPAGGLVAMAAEMPKKAAVVLPLESYATIRVHSDEPRADPG